MRTSRSTRSMRTSPLSYPSAPSRPRRCGRPALGTHSWPQSKQHYMCIWTLGAAMEFFDERWLESERYPSMEWRRHIKVCCQSAWTCTQCVDVHPHQECVFVITIKNTHSHSRP